MKSVRLGCEDSDKSSLIARYFISLQAGNTNSTRFDATDLHDLQTGFHSIDFSADRRLA